MENYRIIKRDGKEVDFEEEKIVNAVSKANHEIEDIYKLSECQIRAIANNVKDQVAALHAFQHVVIVVEVAPYYFKPRRFRIGLQNITVLFGIPCENNYILFVSVFQHFFQACKAHSSGSAGNEYALFHDITHPSCRWS